MNHTEKHVAQGKYLISISQILLPMGHMPDLITTNSMVHTIIYILKKKKREPKSSSRLAKICKQRG